MMNILDQIFAHKRDEVALAQRTRPLSQVRSDAEAAAPARDFVAALRSANQANHSPALIAEVKCASPSRGILVKDFDPLRLARTYQENGAAAISVLTDERFFKGHLDYLRQIASISARPPLLQRPPLLRKDFVCDPYQIYEARAAGADAVLLIVAYLEHEQLADFHSLTGELGMTALVEVHSHEELQTALKIQPRLVGINNRDLRDFSVRLETTLALRGEVPDEVCLVAERGIHTPDDAARLGAAGVNAILVGEALVTAADVGQKVRSLALPASIAAQ